MEAQLLKIGLGLLVYGLVVRWIFKKKAFIGNQALIAALHIFFTTSIAALIGFVVSASADLHGPNPRWPMALGSIGLLWGIFQYKSKKPGQRSELLASDMELADTSYSAVILAAVIMYAVVQAFKIPSGSMEDTLHIKDHLFVNKFMYGIRIPWTEKRILKWRDVRRGDVVVFECPPMALSEEERERRVRKDFIKRAVGIPGDEITVKNKRLYVNGVLQQEPYAVYRDPMIIPDGSDRGEAREQQLAWEQGRWAQHSYARDNFGPVKIPPKSYFVMGDNRDGSFDGRFWGPLPNRLLKGKAWFVYWPLRRIKVIR